MGEIVDFIIMGGIKCGTMATLRNLGVHPKIWIAMGEPHFFDRKWYKGLDWYLRRIATPGEAWVPNPQVAENPDVQKVLELTSGEKTPCLLNEKRWQRRIKKTFPKVKLIVLLRDPIDRFYSHWAMRQSKIALKENKEIYWGDIRWDEPYIDDFFKCGHYSDHLHDLFRVFPREQVHVAISEHILKDMDGEHNKMIQFLGLEPYDSPSIKSHMREYGRRIHFKEWHQLHDYYKLRNEELFEVLEYEISEWSQCPHLIG